MRQFYGGDDSLFHLCLLTDCMIYVLHNLLFALIVPLMRFKGEKPTLCSIHVYELMVVVEELDS